MVEVICPCGLKMTRYPDKIKFKCDVCKTPTISLMECDDCSYKKCLSCCGLDGSTAAPAAAVSALLPSSLPVSQPPATAAKPVPVTAAPVYKAPAAVSTPSAVVKPATTTITATSSGDWAEYKTPDGKKYYHNKKTNTTTWERPKEMGAAEEEVDVDAILASLSVGNSKAPVASKPTAVVASQPARVDSNTPVPVRQNESKGPHHFEYKIKHATEYEGRQGEIYVEVSGGSNPNYDYTWYPQCKYTWSTDPKSVTAYELQAGEYKLKVLDGSLKETTQVFVISQPPKPADYDRRKAEVEAYFAENPDSDDEYTPSSRSSSSSAARSSAGSSGAEKSSKPAMRTCPSCHGDRKKVCGRNNCNSKCTNCGGTRKVTCNVCKGQGEIRN